MRELDAILRNLMAPEVGRLSVLDIFVGLSLAFLIGMLISYIYKKTFQGVLYSYSFSTSLVMMSLITSLIIMIIGINLVLTLGMVGALSIVRFRTAIKDPMDIVFIFWAIAIGLATGAKLYLPALIGTAFIGLAVIFLFKYRASDLTFMLVIRYNEDAYVDDNVVKELKKLKYSLKSKTLARGKMELIVELRLKGEDTSFVEKLSSINGVSDTVLIRYSGEHVS